MSHASDLRLLHRLARLYAIQTAYYDVNHQRKPASVDSLVAILCSLGAPMASLQDVPSALRQRYQALWQQLLEPVVIAWNGNLPSIQLRLSADLDKTPLGCRIKLETGEEKRWHWPVADLPLVKHAEIEGVHYLAKQLRLQTRLPWGYHWLSLSLGEKCARTLIISTPIKAYTPTDKIDDRMWGVFLPLYALHTDNSWGGGNFSDLGSLAGWLADMGARTVATLPLLATFLGKTSDPSPYLPVSRLFWNEFYLDINRVPELKKCASARALLESSSLQEEITHLRHLPLTDYSRQMALKRRVLEELCLCLFSEPSRRLDEIEHFANVNSVVNDYARFRATGEKQGISWQSWPQPLRDGALRDTDYNDQGWRYHLYVQWLTHQQLESVSKKIRSDGLRLYLDLPLGAHPDGYDVWREREAFTPDTSAGAPPDTIFTRGQNWVFPPLHPEKIREQGYRYVIACLRHHLKYANILRIDHVMSLHRLFFIPSGMETSQGIYVRYCSEEFYATLSLEAHRHNAIIVGEDLGTVPPYVRPAMKKHGLHRIYVLHYELASNRRRRLPPVPSKAIASLNTHDMPPFAALWQGQDIGQRRRLGLLDRLGARAETDKLLNMKATLVTFLRAQGWLREPEADVRTILTACLSFLAASRAQVVLVNLEDLWLETQPQNVPTTKDEYPNWRRKGRYTFEQFCQLPQVVDTLRTVNEFRKRGKYR
jgi:4-alpha-glucanotransferase